MLLKRRELGFRIQEPAFGGRLSTFDPRLWTCPGLGIRYPGPGASAGKAWRSGGRGIRPSCESATGPWPRLSLVTAFGWGMPQPERRWGHRRHSGRRRADPTGAGSGQRPGLRCSGDVPIAGGITGGDTGATVWRSRGRRGACSSLVTFHCPRAPQLSLSGLGRGSRASTGANAGRVCGERQLSSMATCCTQETVQCGAQGFSVWYSCARWSRV
jgi:hypothetical protein